MSLTIAQTDFDNIVLGIADHQVRLGIVAAALRRQGDPDAWRREEELMILQNIIDSLRDYDVDADFLTDENIWYLHELATIVVENCPI